MEGTGFLTLHLFSEAVHIIGLVGVSDSIGPHSRELVLVTIATFPGSVDGVSVGKSMWECDTRNRGKSKVTVLVAFASIGGDRHKTASVQVCFVCQPSLQSQCCPQVWLHSWYQTLSPRRRFPYKRPESCGFCKPWAPVVSFALQQHRAAADNM